MSQSKWLDDVQKFHAKFGLPVSTNNPGMLQEDVMDFRLGFLMEELDEIGEGFATNNIEDVADGLIDLIYVAIGTGLFMGLPMDELWDEVQRANMAKERATSSDQSKRSSSFDVIKPEGWVGPDIAGVLASCHTH